MRHIRLAVRWCGFTAILSLLGDTLWAVMHGALLPLEDFTALYQPPPVSCRWVSVVVPELFISAAIVYLAEGFRTRNMPVQAACSWVVFGVVVIFRVVPAVGRLLDLDLDLVNLYLDASGIDIASVSGSNPKQMLQQIQSNSLQRIGTRAVGRLCVYLAIVVLVAQWGSVAKPEQLNPGSDGQGP